MPFWTDATNQDPKRGYRFLVQLGNYPQGAEWYAKKAKKPSFTINNVEHKFLNHTFHYPGRLTWDEVTVELVDPVDPDATLNTAAIIRASGYAPPTSTTPYGSTISKKAAVAALNTVIITQIDGVGEPLETWTLQNAWISKVEFGELSYDSDELTGVTLTLRYDWASIWAANKSQTGASRPGDGKVVDDNDFFQLGTGVAK